MNPTRYKGIAYLKSKLESKKDRIELRYGFYDMKNRVEDFGISTPDSMKYFSSTLGWCGKAVDSIADRLNFREFRNDDFGMNEIFTQNNPDILFDSAILSALICSCSFGYIYEGEDGVRIQIVDGRDATGIIDPVTGLLKEGYAVLARDEYDIPTTEAYFTAEETIFIEAGNIIRKSNPTGIPLLVPIVYRPDAKRPFGHSRISRACMSITKGAIRTIKRSEISAEFYSFPQKYVTGLSNDAEQIEDYRASISSMLTFTNDEEGNHPILGQFQQQSMAPHAEQLKMFASAFAGETGLTVDDLGFVSDNPSSAEAIKSSHENLRLTAAKAQKKFGTGFLNIGYVAACLRDEQPYERQEIYNTIPVWEPIFIPDASSLSTFGDAVIKINNAIPNCITAQTIRDITGIEVN